MSCSDTFDNLETCDYPLDRLSSTARQLQPIPANLEAEAPSNPSTDGIPTVHDDIPVPLIDGVPASTTGPALNLFTISEPTAGLALTGFCPPGLVALIAPANRKNDLLNTFSQFGNQLGSYLCTSGPIVETLSSGNSNVPFFPLGTFLLRPGDAVSFGRRITGGFVGMFLQCWQGGVSPVQPSPLGAVVIPSQYGAYSYTYGGSGPNTAGATDGRFVNFDGQYGPACRPFIRLFDAAHAVPRSVSYSKVPGMSTAFLANYNGQTPPYPDFRAINGGPPAPTGLDMQYAVPVGTESVTVALGWAINGALPVTLTNAWPLAPLASSGFSPGPFDLHISWMLSDGICHRNSTADDWIVGGRGQASMTHDVEVYSVPRNAVGCIAWANSQPLTNIRVAYIYT